MSSYIALLYLHVCQDLLPPASQPSGSHIASPIHIPEEELEPPATILRSSRRARLPARFQDFVPRHSRGARSIASLAHIPSHTRTEETSSMPHTTPVPSIPVISNPSTAWESEPNEIGLYKGYPSLPRP